MKYTLEIDNQFKLLIPPLSSEEHKQLEENIVRDGCREPLCVWNNTILDGHNRYEICIRLGITFSVAQIFLKGRDDAVAWICANQLGRRNISENTRRYLIGKRYEAEKRTNAFNPSGKNQHSKKELRYQNVTEPPLPEPIGRTRERLANEYGISHATVARYGHYARAIDDLARINPTLSHNILSDKVKIRQEDIVAFTNLPPSEASSVSTQIPHNGEGMTCYSKSHQATNPQRLQEKNAPSIRPAVAIKEPPAYDPDATVESLIFTIPSWISAIERTAAETDCRAISPAACLKLKMVMRRLAEAVGKMADMMEETKHGQ